MFDEETENLLASFVEELMEAVRDGRLIFHEGCAIVTAPVGAAPEYITVTVDGINDPNVMWRGTPPAPGIGDIVIVWENTVSHRREIWSPGGVAGAASLHVHDHSNVANGGQNLRQIQEFELDDATILTIDVNGTVTRTQAYHVIAANAGVADNLDQIDGGVQGDVLVIRPDVGDTITVRHNEGGAGDNIWLAGGADIVLDNDDHLILVFDGTWWCDQSGGAAGGGTWDQVYDFGGAGAGRQSTVDTGAWQAQASGSHAMELQRSGAGNNPKEILRIIALNSTGVGGVDLAARMAIYVEDDSGAPQQAGYIDWTWLDATAAAAACKVSIVALDGAGNQPYLVMGPYETELPTASILHFEDECWRIGSQTINMDFTGTNFDTVPELQALGVRSSDSDTPFPTTIRSTVSGTWAHTAGVGWRPSFAVDSQGPAILVPLMRGANFELALTFNYNPANVAHECNYGFGYIDSSNHIGAYARIIDNSAAASQLLAILATNNGNDTFTDQYTGAALAGAATRTYKFRAQNGCVGVWDDQDDSWHWYQGRQSVGVAYTPVYVFIQAYKYTAITWAQCDIASLSLTYLL